MYINACGIYKNGTDEHTCRVGIEKQMWRMDSWTWWGGEGEGGMNWEISIDIYTLPCVKQKAGGILLYSREGSAQGSVMT